MRTRAATCPDSSNLSDAPADPTTVSSSPTARSSSANSKQAYTTEIVKALFVGSSVGDVVQDFSCSFQRQTGRLYVSTDGLFFYSQLFGFEKRVQLQYNQTLEITNVRTTSLSVQTTEGESYIFRSFDDREHVLEIISTYHCNGGTTQNDGVISAHSLEGVNPGAGEKPLDEMCNDTSVGNDSSPIPDLSNVQSRVSQNIDKKEKANAGVNESVESTHENDTTHWKELQQLSNGWESAIANLKLSCKSVQDHFDLFLMDDATNSLYVFLSDVMGDKHISIGAWQTDVSTETETHSRTITYEHKSGISVAKVARQQTYQRCGSHACLKNVTSIKAPGVPSDTFFVEDMWLIESTKNQGIILSVRFRVNFTKPTMLKSIIQNRAKTEFREWYKHYSLFLRQKMHQKIPLQEEIAPTTSSAKTDADWVELLLTSARQYRSDLSTWSPNTPILFIVTLAFIIYRLKQRVMVLEEIVEEFERRLFELEK